MSIIAMILMVIGAINWGLVGAFDFNLVSAIFGATSAASMLIYALIALSGIWGVVMLFRGDFRQRQT